MSYRMPKKMEDEFENRHGFRSSDLRTFAIMEVIFVILGLFLVRGLYLKGVFLLFTGVLSYYLLLPNKKGKHGASKNARNWQIYWNFLFADHQTYKAKELEEQNEN